MARTMRGVVSAAGLVCFCALAFGEDLISNWSAPPYWSAPVRVRVAQESRGSLGTQAAEALPTAPVPFVGIMPCRIVDTRGNGFTGAYGPPALLGNATARSFNVPAGPCPGIPADAAAFSINIAAILPAADGFLTAFPTGGAQPNASTLNFLAGEVVANSAVIGAGTSGSISVFVNIMTDVIIDINGYYAGSVVTGLNTLSGDVTLAPGSNVSITPSGQTLTIASTGGLPAGSVNQTLRHNGTSWVANSALTSDGNNVMVNTVLTLPDPQTLVKAGPNQILYTDTSNLSLGVSAGGTTGSQNTVLGSAALDSNTTGSSNVAIGYHALTNVTSGNTNIAIGTNVGSGISTGSNNIYIGNAGFANESGQIRIGTVENITGGTVIVGISGFQSIGGIPVIVNGGGRLGTTTSSIRFKEDVRSLGSRSDDLMKLRPVAFRYKESALQEYGLIAEEVADVYPELVVNDDQGRPLAIRSQLLDPLLLNEIQKQRCEIEELKARLERVEGKSAP